MTPRRVDEAEALYREALRVDPNNPRTTAHAHFNLALIEHLDYQPPDLDAAEARAGARNIATCALRDDGSSFAV
jgi:hypothetical protein